MLEIAMDTLPITTPRQAGIYVRQARESQEITRAALAKKAGVSERLARIARARRRHGYSARQVTDRL